MMWKIVLPVLAAVFAVGSGGLVGGLSDVNANDDGVRDALNYSVAQHNKRTNDTYLYNVSDVIKAQSQVVAGMKYILTVRMARTSCRKDSVNEECAIHTDPKLAKTFLCTFTVWSRPWLNKIKMEEDCDKHQQGDS